MEKGSLIDNKCKLLIKNWNAIDGLKLDFNEVQVDGVLLDNQPNDNHEKWIISLYTTIYTDLDDNGRDVYSVRWRFRDLWGNIALFSFQGFVFSGALSLKYIDYDDFSIVGFSIDKPDGTSIFRFEQPDEISIESVENKGHQTMQDIYPEDYK